MQLATSFVKVRLKEPFICLRDISEIVPSTMAIQEPFSVNTVPDSNLHTSLLDTQNFFLVWLDANIDEINDPDCRNTIIELRHVVNTIYTFVDVTQCINFLAKTHNETAVMIVSGALGQSIMPHIHNMSRLTTIYIFCRDKSRHEHWVKNWFKIKGVFTDILSICAELAQTTTQYEQDSIPVSFASMNEGTSTANLNQLDQSFMYTQVLKEILLNIKFSKTSIKEFTTYCRGQFANNQKELDYINKFEHEYSKYTPIWWYTNECFLHSMLNRALRIMDIDIIIKMGFFVIDLHHQIEKLHKQQYRDPNKFQPFTVYRGQSLSMADFNQMMNTVGGLISFNNFISSSKKQNIALIFARRALTDPDSMGIVFIMKIDTAIYSTPFALVSGVSFYKAAEQEILFSMHTIFRIGKISQIEPNNNRLWEVELTITNDNDQQLNELTQRLRKDTQGAEGWHCLGQLLLKIGLFDRAKELYNFLLKQTSDKKEKAHIYHQLGWINDKLGNYTEAISFYKKGLAIDEKTLHINHPELATTYDNVGSVYNQLGDYTEALSFHQKALSIYRKTLPPDHSDLAASLNNIGLVYFKLNEYSKSESSHKEALEIYKKTLPSNHPLLAASFNSIGLVHDNLNDYSKALWYYEKALEKYQKALPPDHPDLAICHQNTGKALEKMCEYSKALAAHEKALAIFQKTLSSNHQKLATCYSYIASIYNHMQEYSQALSFYKKTLDIRQKSLSPTHSDLITTYNNIGEVYDHMNEYSEAISFYQKAMKVCPRTILSDQRLLVSFYHNIAEAYYKMGHRDKAVTYAEDAVRIGQGILPPDHSELQKYYKTLGLVKQML